MVLKAMEKAQVQLAETDQPPAIISYEELRKILPPSALQELNRVDEILVKIEENAAAFERGEINEEEAHATHTKLGIDAAFGKNNITTYDPSEPNEMGQYTESSVGAWGQWKLSIKVGNFEEMLNNGQVQRSGTDHDEVKVGLVLGSNGVIGGHANLFRTTDDVNFEEQPGKLKEALQLVCAAAKSVENGQTVDLLDLKEQCYEVTGKKMTGIVGTSHLMRMALRGGQLSEAQSAPTGTATLEPPKGKIVNLPPGFTPRDRQNGG